MLSGAGALLQGFRQLHHFQLYVLVDARNLLPFGRGEISMSLEGIGEKGTQQSSLSLSWIKLPGEVEERSPLKTPFDLLEPGNQLFDLCQDVSARAQLTD